MKSCCRVLSLIFLIIELAQNTYASSAPEMPKKPVRTNLNEVSREFEEHIENKALLDSKVEGLRASGIEGIETADPSSILGAGEGSKVSSEASRLSRIGEYDLEDAGRRERSNPKNSYFNNFETDYSKPGALMHKRDVEEIVSSTNRKLGELTRTLRDLGIDCREEAKSAEIKDPYLIDIERSESKEIEYDQKFCEQPRNSYSCVEKLSTRCADPRLVSGKLTDIRGNMVHTIDAYGNLRIGVDRERYYFHPWGSQQDYEFSFNVDNVEGIASFKLVQVDWADYIVIKLNDYLIFAEPEIRGGKLEMSTDPRHFRWNREMYYGVDIGIGDFRPTQTLQYYSRTPNYEAKSFLKNGVNRLKMRLVYGGGGKIHTILKYQEKRCESWIEERNETCTLN